LYGRLLFENREEAGNGIEWSGQVGVPITDELRVERVYGVENAGSDSFRFALVAGQREDSGSILKGRANAFENLMGGVGAAIVDKDQPRRVPSR
jgi:hypothetical protein